MHRISRILAPVDFSRSSRAALAEALLFGERFEAPVHVLHVWEVPHNVRPDLMVWIEGSDGQPVSQIASSDASRQMNAFLADLTPQERQRVEVALEGGDPVDKILEVANHGGFDLIVMGTHGRRGLTHLLLGSVAEKIVRRSTCPVLTVRTREEQAK
jgi:universal stress protein A